MEEYKEWYIEKDWPYNGVCRPQHFLGVKDDVCGSVISLKVGSGRVLEVKEELSVRVEKLFSIRAKTEWRVDLKFYRRRGTESSTKNTKSFAEMYTVRQDNGPCYIAGRQVAGSGLFQTIAMNQAVADILLANNFDSQRPRAIASILGTRFISNADEDLTFRIGTLRHGAVLALVLTVRFNPLPPSHPGALKIQRQVLELWSQDLGTDLILHHAPLVLDHTSIFLNKKLCKTKLTSNNEDPFLGSDHFLALVNCFRTTLFGSVNDQTSMATASSPEEAAGAAFPFPDAPPPSSLFPSSQHQQQPVLVAAVDTS